LSGLVRVCNDVILISLLHFSFDYALRAFDKSIPFTCFETLRAVPHDAVNEFYDSKGNFNLDYLCSAKTAGIATEVDNDDKSIDSGMPGLQTRHSEDTSSDDDSDYDKKPTKASTTMQWKVPIDDSDGEKFTCQRVRAQRTKRNAKRLHNRCKKAALKKELIKKYAIS
jgi:hypothetical protein